MRKFLFIAAIVLLNVCLSCNDDKDEGGLSDKAQKNLDTGHAISNMFVTKDFSRIGDYIAQDAVDHSGDQMGKEVKGLANLKTTFEQMMANFDSPKNEIIKEMADDEYVMSWMRFTGTLKNDMPGMKAGSYDVNSIELFKLKDGKMVEHWSFMQPADMAKMMGGDMSQQQMPTVDSTKK